MVGCHRLPLILVCCGDCLPQCADSADDRHVLQSTLHSFHYLSLPESALHCEGGEEVPPVGALEGEGPVCVCVCVCVCACVRACVCACVCAFVVLAEHTLLEVMCINVI